MMIAPETQSKRITALKPGPRSMLSCNWKWYKLYWLRTNFKQLGRWFGNSSAKLQAADDSAATQRHNPWYRLWKVKPACVFALWGDQLLSSLRETAATIGFSAFGCVRLHAKILCRFSAGFLQFSDRFQRISVIFDRFLRFPAVF